MESLHSLIEPVSGVPMKYGILGCELSMKSDNSVCVLSMESDNSGCELSMKSYNSGCQHAQMLRSNMDFINQRHRHMFCDIYCITGYADIYGLIYCKQQQLLAKVG